MLLWLETHACWQLWGRLGLQLAVCSGEMGQLEGLRVSAAGPGRLDDSGRLTCVDRPAIWPWLTNFLKPHFFH